MKRIFILLFAIILSLPIFSAEKETKVLIKTTVGKITVKLYNDTPLHRDNFLNLVQEHQYDSIMFHRVIKLFMIQAGEKYAPFDTTKQINVIDTAQVKIKFLKKVVRTITFQSFKKKKDKTSYPYDPNYKAPEHTIPAEIVYPKYFHKRGQLCAARFEDKTNPERKSSGFQFYIVTGKFFTDYDLDKMEIERNITLTPEQRQAYKVEGGAPHLDGTYTIFGEVTKGMKVVQKIELSTVGFNDDPLKEIRIKKTKILKK